MGPSNGANRSNITDDGELEVAPLDAGGVGPRAGHRRLARYWHATLAMAMVALAVVAPLASLEPTRAAFMSLLPTPAPTLEPNLIILAQGTAQTDIAPAAWDALRARPVRLPILPPGGVCPAAQGRSVHPAYGPAIGDGPAYIVGMGTDGVLHAVGATVGSHGAAAWGYQFALFIIDPNYQGPVLARGAQIDGPHTLLFNGGLDQYNGFSPDTITLLTQLRLESSPAFGGPWPTFPTDLRMLTSGCYAIQFDGATFSEVVVFRIVAGG